MRQLLRLICVPVVVVFGLITFTVASADGGTPPPSAQSLLAMFVPLICSGLGYAGYALKNWMPKDGFFHQWYGHALVTLGVGICGSLVSYFQARHWTKAALVAALVAAMSTWLGGLIPKGKMPPSESSSPTIPIQKA